MPKDKELKEKATQEENRPARWEDFSTRDLLNRFFDQDFWPIPPSIFSRQWFPRLDINETDTEVRVIADVPGVDPDQINIDIQNNRLRISGKADRESRSEERPYRYERSYGEFRREFALPARVKEDEIKAVYKNGLLTITLPKAEEEKRKKIMIEKK